MLEGGGKKEGNVRGNEGEESKGGKIERKGREERFLQDKKNERSVGGRGTNKSRYRGR